MSPLVDILKFTFLPIAKIPVIESVRIKHEHCWSSSKGMRIKTYFVFGVF